MDLHYLIFRMDLVQSRGKQNKKVTTLFTPEMRIACDILVEYRQECGILANNPYLFANSALLYLNQYQCLTHMAKEAGCDSPNLVTSTRLRKYLATVCQVSRLDHLKHIFCNTILYTCVFTDTYFNIRLC